MKSNHPLAVAIAAAAVGAFALSLTDTARAAAVPPCESQPTTSPSPTKPASPKNLRIIDTIAALFSFGDDAEATSGPSVREGEEEAAAETTTEHSYYEALGSRSDCMAAYSLRDQAQIEQYRKNRSLPLDVNYFWPNDPEPRRQDGAKVVIRTDANSLKTQVHLPVPDYGTKSLLIIWDAWWGKEFRNDYSKLEDYKAFQLGSPGCSIFTETQARFRLAEGTPYVAFTNIRQYSNLGPNTSTPIINGRNYGNGKLGPLSAEFGILPETWTRYFLFLDPDGEWYRLSMWLADRTRPPVRIYDRVQVNPDLPARWECFRLEYNTSANTVVNRTELISYARNVVMLRGVTDVSPLLQQPLK